MMELCPTSETLPYGDLCFALSLQVQMGDNMKCLGKMLELNDFRNILSVIAKFLDQYCNCDFFQ